MARKEPFERIISLLDRKKILKKIINDKTQVICKTPAGDLIPFVLKGMTPDGQIEGTLLEKKSPNTKTKSAILFFYCGKDRYFIHTKLIRVAPHPISVWRAQPSIEFYKLNRRQSYRTDVPANVRVTFHVSMVGTQRCNVMARVLEFSAGGAQIRWFGNPTLELHSQMRGKIIWLKDKEMSVHALVRHRRGDGIFGLEFTNLDSVQMNRLKLMSIELQQFVNYLKS